jgi:hypothetical protein
MLCTKYIIVFSLENNFPIVLSGEVLCPLRWLRHFTSPDPTIGEQIIIIKCTMKQSESILREINLDKKIYKNYAGKYMPQV